MYWFYLGDGAVNNSISFGPIPSGGAPVAAGDIRANAGNGGGGNSQFRGQGLSPRQNTYIFDNTLFVIDQNISEDYEPAAAASSSPSELLSVNLSSAESDPQRRCASGEAGCEPGAQR
jgi:hypothetical protein